VNYDYIGGRMIEKILGNATKLTLLNDAGSTNEGHDALGRLVKLRHVGPSANPLAGFEYTYNRENFKTVTKDLQTAQLSEVYKMDSVYRIVDFKRGTLNAQNDGIEGTPVNFQTWSLDGVGNWANTVVDGTTQTQVANNMNEYETFAGVAQVHDENGNRTDDGTRLCIFDAFNRMVEVWQKGQQGEENILLGRYTYDAFNRRISKTFTREKAAQGEYETDESTLALYHFNNEQSGPIEDSSGNNNHGQAHKHVEQGVEGLWDTKAVAFDKNSEIHVKVRKGSSLNNLQDKLTVETWVYLNAPKCKEHWHKKDLQKKFCKVKSKHGWLKKWYWFCRHCWKDWPGGDLVDLPGSYKLEIDAKDRKAYFTLFTERTEKPRHTRKISVHTDEEIPTDAWVHLAGVYTGDKLVLYVDGVKQTDEKAASGEVKEGGAVLRLGGLRCDSKMEECRISNAVRSTFGGSQAVKETVLRSVFWSGWQVVEERERTAEIGRPLGEERVARQFVDGGSIDEHLAVDVYSQDGASVEKTYWFHQNHRGDTVALTDETGSVVKRYAYSSYGEAFESDDNGNLSSVEDLSFGGYYFQGRSIDEETGLYFFRRRMYDSQQGRFCQRDPLVYADGMGLYES
ncbi:MAG: LamG-like jellyroll fold domain-containing protein, partial [Chloroflexota bacterium]